MKSYIGLYLLPLPSNDISASAARSNEQTFIIHNNAAALQAISLKQLLRYIYSTVLTLITILQHTDIRNNNSLLLHTGTPTTYNYFQNTLEHWHEWCMINLCWYEVTIADSQTVTKTSSPLWDRLNHFCNRSDKKNRATWNPGVKIQGLHIKSSIPWIYNNAMWRCFSLKK